MDIETLVFLDLETTGASSTRDRITEIGLLWVAPNGEVRRWQSLVNPGQGIPYDIQYLTGITPAMVHDAPSFAALAPTLFALLAGKTLVAHNARFDYSFLRSEFARLDQRLTLPTLCTVRLSRELFPEQSGHSLEAIIQRLRLPVTTRHRAMADTDAIYLLYRHCLTQFGHPVVAAAAKLALKRPTLPLHLLPSDLSELPKHPGIYIFRGAADEPLYVGKAKNIHERVNSHFAADSLSEKELRLSREVRRVEVVPAAGEIHALLIEIEHIHRLRPAHNIKLRKNVAAVAVTLEGAAAKPRFHRLAESTSPLPAGCVAVFASAATARTALTHAAREARLCLTTLGLERNLQGGPCFNYQLKRCVGACVGEEFLAAHGTRAAAAFARFALLKWPHSGATVFAEAAGQLHAFHVFDQWRWVATFATAAEAQDCATHPNPPTKPFDLAIYGVIRKALGYKLPSADKTAVVALS